MFADGSVTVPVKVLGTMAGAIMFIVKLDRTVAEPPEPIPMFSLYGYDQSLVRGPREPQRRPLADYYAALPLPILDETAVFVWDDAKAAANDFPCCRRVTYGQWKAQLRQPMPLPPLPANPRQRRRGANPGGNSVFSCSKIFCLFFGRALARLIIQTSMAFPFWGVSENRS